MRRILIEWHAMDEPRTLLWTLVLASIVGAAAPASARAAASAEPGSPTGNRLDLSGRVIDDSLKIEFRASTGSDVPICREGDSVYVWNEDGEGYRYFMIGTGFGRRENLWTGTGHAENTGWDYFIVSIRNLGAQFGEEFARELVENFSFNGVENPGRVEDGGFGIFPERHIDRTGLAGVREIVARATYFEEENTNHFILRFELENDSYELRNLSPKVVVVMGDGAVDVKILRAKK